MPKKFPKSPNSRFLKMLKTQPPAGSSSRTTVGAVNDRITHREFKVVLPMLPKPNVAVRGSDSKPSM